VSLSLASGQNEESNFTSTNSTRNLVEEDETLEEKGKKSFF
jgi:hypothetical protein